MVILEAVPNLSVGRDPQGIRALQQVAMAHQRVCLLHTDTNADANRSVLTLVGEPAPLVEVLFQVYQKALEVIDMRRHRGAHPRMGAVDVCPIVPVKGINLAGARQWAFHLAQRVGTELELPLVAYEALSDRPDRRLLGDVRRGEYEGWKERILDPADAPDFGPARFNDRFGVGAIGARTFLVAYNIGLDSSDPEVAKRIARRVRERNGGLPWLRAIGWLMPNYGHVQVSMNLTNPAYTGLMEAWQAVGQEADALGVKVLGSELIGLVPEAILLRTGQQLGAASNADALHQAVNHLRLEYYRPFDPNERVLERVMTDKLAKKAV